MHSLAELAAPFPSRARATVENRKVLWREEDLAVLQWLLRDVGSAERSRSVAEDLLDHFGSLPDCLSAPAFKLLEAGLEPSVIHQIQSAWHLVGRVSFGRFRERNVLNSIDDVRQYLRVTMAAQPVEILRVLHLDSRFHLISDELQQVGTVGHVPVHLREIAQRALNLGARGVILVHNHPSGCADPTKEDIARTNDVRDVLKPLDIRLIDHLIVGRNQIVSLSEMGLYSAI